MSEAWFCQLLYDGSTILFLLFGFYGFDMACIGSIVLSTVDMVEASFCSMALVLYGKQYHG